MDSLQNARRVANAAKALDRIYPGWYDCVDVNKLDLLSPSNCVLAQIDRGKNRVWRRLWRTKGWKQVQREIGLSRSGLFAHMAFSWDDDYAPGMFAHNGLFLDLWINEIEARRVPWQEMLSATVVIEDGKIAITPFASQGRAITSCGPRFVPFAK